MSTALPMPVRLETARLTLRPWQADDAAALHAALCESVGHLKRWIPWATPSAPTEEETQERLAKWIADFASGANHIYAIFHGSPGGLVGGAGLYPRVGPGALEIGYWIRAAEVGAGFATEVTRELTRVAFDAPGVARVEIHTDPANLPSRKIPEKLGYRLATIRAAEPGLDGRLRDTVVYEVTREEYQP